MAIEYAASAEPGDELAAAAWIEGDAWNVRLVRLDGDVEIVRARLGRGRPADLAGGRPSPAAP
ncbi:MAG: hypothetical protein HY264_03400 [Chloroflexi bacterium]|nr:hypothetical protein [Chloroflexota bacterium]